MLTLIKLRTQLIATTRADGRRTTTAIALIISLLQEEEERISTSVALLMEAEEAVEEAEEVPQQEVVDVAADMPTPTSSLGDIDMKTKVVESGGDSTLAWSAMGSF